MNGGVSIASPTTSEGRRIAACLARQPLIRPDPGMSERWSRVADGVAAMLEGMARTAQAPEWLGHLATYLEDPGSAFRVVEGRPHSRRLSFSQAAANAWNGLRSGQAIHLEIGRKRGMGAAECAAMERAQGLGLVLSLSSRSDVPAMIVASMERMPFPAASVDRIEMNAGLSSSLSPFSVLSECHRILRPGGALRATVSFMAPQLASDDLLRFTPAFFSKALPAAGFAAVETTYAPEPLSALTGLAQQMEPAKALDAEMREEAQLLRAMVVGVLGTISGADHLFRGRKPFGTVLKVHAVKAAAGDACVVPA